MTNHNVSRLAQVEAAVRGTVGTTSISELMTQLNDRAVATAFAASTNEDEDGPKMATTLRLPPDINTFFRVWADVLGCSAQQIIEQVLRGYYNQHRDAVSGGNAVLRDDDRKVTGKQR